MAVVLITLVVEVLGQDIERALARLDASLHVVPKPHEGGQTDNDIELVVNLLPQLLKVLGRLELMTKSALYVCLQFVGVVGIVGMLLKNFHCYIVSDQEVALLL